MFFFNRFRMLGKKKESTFLKLPLWTPCQTAGRGRFRGDRTLQKSDVIKAPLGRGTRNSYNRKSPACRNWLWRDVRGINWLFHFWRRKCGYRCHMHRPCKNNFARFWKIGNFAKHPRGAFFARSYSLSPQCVRLTSTEYRSKHIFVIHVAKRIYMQYFASYYAFVDPLDTRKKKHGLPRMAPTIRVLLYILRSTSTTSRRCHVWYIFYSVLGTRYIVTI